MATCPICSSEADLIQAGMQLRVDCPRCSRYTISQDAVMELHGVPLSNASAAVISGWVRENAPERILTYDLPHLRGLPAPTIQERLNRLLIALAKDTASLGQDVDLQGKEPRYISTTYSQDEGELQYFVEHLHQIGLVNAQAHWVFPSVTPAGYAHIESLDRNPASPVGFCAMWFDAEVLPVWKQAISPAIAAAGYEPKRIDNVEHNNRIDDEIIAWIRRSRFVVAELTGHRQGVYFEAGLAMGLGLPVVWLVRSDQLESTHFDNRQYNFIVWTDDALPDAMRRLQNRIEATIGRGPRLAVTEQ